MFESLERVTTSSRIFCLAAILGLLLVSRDGRAVLSLALLTVLAVVAVYVTRATAITPAFAATVEAALVGLIIGLALPSGAALLPYLVVLALIAGISQGVQGVSAVTITQILTIALVSLTVLVPSERASTYQVLAPWFVTSILGGLVGAWLRDSSRLASTTELSSYGSARKLMAQLRALTDQMPSGLDLVGLATQTLGVLQRLGDSRHAAIFLRTEGGLLTPVAYSDQIAQMSLLPTDALVNESSATVEPVWSRTDSKHENVRRAAWPLRVGSRVIGVALADMPPSPSRAAARSLMAELDAQSLRLDAAMTFDEIRARATTQERSRLAREIHDGIAQEVASLGYWVDDLCAAAGSEESRAKLSELRRELSRVVNDLRLSIYDLRSETLTLSGLGAALSDYVRQVGSRSRMTVHLKLDEGPVRLRPEVESELLRIAGEAITNARKHAVADNLWVECTVKPPFARLEIRDDGSGSWRARTDSYGLQIMRERANRIGATFEVLREVDGSTQSGTIVRATLGEGAAPVAVSERDASDDVRNRNTSPAGR